MEEFAVDRQKDTSSTWEGKEKRWQWAWRLILWLERWDWGKTGSWEWTSLCILFSLWKRWNSFLRSSGRGKKKKKVRRLTDQNQADGRSYWISWLKLGIRSVLEIVWVYYLSSISFIYKEVNEKEVDHCIGNTHRMQNKLFYLELILCRSVCIRQWEFI